MPDKYFQEMLTVWSIQYDIPDNACIRLRAILIEMIREASKEHPRLSVIPFMLEDYRE